MERWVKNMWSEIYIEARTYNNLGSSKDSNHLCLILRIPYYWIAYLLIFRLKVNPPILMPLEDRILGLVIK